MDLYSRDKKGNCQNYFLFQMEKRRYLPHCCSDKSFKLHKLHLSSESLYFSNFKLTLSLLGGGQFDPPPCSLTELKK